MFRTTATRSDWFQDLFGFQESLSAVRENFVIDGTALSSKVNNKIYSIGTFTTPSLAALRESVPFQNDPDLAGTLTLSHAFGDVAALQASPSSKFATFQVASQFNCLEFIGPGSTPEMGVTDYIGDRTQGPCCSISCGPATVFRNYFVDVVKSEDGEVKVEQKGQTKHLQINNLDDVEKHLQIDNAAADKYFLVKSGYTLATSQTLEKLNDRLADEAEGAELAETLKQKL
jgi:hypothetical protein